ncbi:MAG: IS200/IS605 family transposase [Bacteroidales bacterium]|nr:IS200/IS605 family transposase [Bacteroidales bacterium]
MGTYTQIIYQIIFHTKYNEKTLIKRDREELYQYITGILQNKKCHLYRIGGVENHIHIVTHLHPSVSLADLVKDIKMASHKLIKEKNLFPKFAGWQDGYSAFTYHSEAKDNLIEYVKNQEKHHAKISLKDELKALLKEHGVEFDEKFV